LKPLVADALAPSGSRAGGEEELQALLFLCCRRDWRWRPRNGKRDYEAVRSSPVLSLIGHHGAGTKGGDVSEPILPRLTKPGAAWKRAGASGRRSLRREACAQNSYRRVGQKAGPHQAQRYAHAHQFKTRNRRLNAKVKGLSRAVSSGDLERTSSGNEDLREGVVAAAVPGPARAGQQWSAARPGGQQGLFSCPAPGMWRLHR